MDKDNKGKSITHLRSMEAVGIVRHIKPDLGWEHLTCPRSTLTLLRKICSDFTPGSSLSCLFVGESGTGKTLAAEVVARQLGMDLMRIDVSAVLKKYIGETEKNLGRVFDAAAGGDVILFFDEADALFGKRSEVKDSHDRYANMEISYLLQRMETRQGLTILAARKKQAIDAAFLRRIRHIVDFPRPLPATRP
jgi:SpoVK/Ycf46/Vps4 family AAA+-type ATPase